MKKKSSSKASASRKTKAASGKAKVGKLKLSLETETFELSCGARLLVSPRPGTPITSLQVHLRGGPSLDEPGLEGTAYLAGGLVDQGTKSRKEEELAAELERCGGSVSGNASSLSGSVVSSEWSRYIKVFADLLMEPSYPAAKVQRQFERLKHRLLIEAQDPRVQAEHGFRRLVYGDHWLGRPAYGSLESLERIKVKHLRAHQRKNWVASRAVIAVCGDVEAQAVRRQLERLLKDWKKGTPLPPRKTVLPERAVRQTRFHAEREQVHLVLGHKGIQRKDPDYANLVVMDHILGIGPGFTNRISKRLRDELGLAYSVSANIYASAGILPGTFHAYIGTSPEHVQTAAQGFLEEMRRIQLEPVTEEELATARDYLVGSFVLGFQRASRRVNWMIASERHGYPVNELEALPKRFAAVTAEDVQAAAQKHLHPDNCCFSISGPLPEKEWSRVLKSL